MKIKMSYHLILVTAIWLSVIGNTFSQNEKFTREAIKSIPSFIELLSIPCDARFPEDIEKNVLWAEKNFGDRGFQLSRIETPTVPLLLAEKSFDNPSSSKTLLVYLQLDGQPVDTAFWNQESPYKPVFKRKTSSGIWEEIEDFDYSDNFDEDVRIFARASSDAKGPVLMFLQALDMMEDENIKPNFRLKIIMDFEEELGSPNLAKAVEANKEKLASDYLIILDGPQHTSGRPTLAFGARGIATVTLKTFGPVFPQHSGHYGNYLTNPALQLSQILAGMKDKEGRVILEGYYDGIEISDDVKSVLASVPDDEKHLLSKMGSLEHDRIAPSLQESLQYPSLNIRGFQSGWVGDEARTIIPSSATAELDLRLVLESEPDRLIAIIKNYIESEGYTVLDHKPTSEERKMYPKICQMNSKIAYQAFRTPIDSPIGIWLTKGLEMAFDEPVVLIRTHGGSIPISPFVNTLNVPAVIVPTVNYDNNQHSPNENLRLGHYRDGIKAFYYIFKNSLE